jgi:hypothetical protein
MVLSSLFFEAKGEVVVSGQAMDCGGRGKKKTGQGLAALG